jgi:hypothetical protein
MDWLIVVLKHMVTIVVVALFQSINVWLDEVRCIQAGHFWLNIHQAGATHRAK